MIIPVILCGGSGTRLLPLSRKSYPKQFSSFLGDQSLFQATAQRLSGMAYGPPLVLTGADFRFLVTDQLIEAGIDGATILIEPEAKNTAAAVLAAALWLERTNPDALMLVAPSDHVVPDAASFSATVEAGRATAEAGGLVTFGVAPDRAETGYGWLERANAANSGAQPLTRFVEKPDINAAEAMLADPRYLWNTGVFLFSVAGILEAFRRHAPDLMAPVEAAVDGARPDLNFHRLDPDSWSGVEAISIDYAVMEKAENLSVVPFLGRWSDLGGWDAVWREIEQDADGNAVGEQALALGCKNALIRSEDSSQTVVGIGLTDTVVVATPDAVLVADRSQVQAVKQAVAVLKDRGTRQAETFPIDHRPWGWFETLALSDRFQVKRIVVKPGAALSLQSHMHRAEHWIVVQGIARVTVDEEVRLVAENESIYVPLGAKHRMENPGHVNMVLIEVQTGTYLGEDDIKRYEDVYQRD